MANYNLVVNSKFQPFSFERYIQPYQLYNEAYKEQQDALSELSLKANIWDKLANEQTDREAYEMYKNYSDDLKNQIDTIAREGISPISRQAMLNLKSRYSKEITPIEQAYKLRQEDIERQKKVSDATGGRTLFSRDARTTSLDKYISGIEDYAQANLDAIKQEGVQGAAAISSRYFNTEEGKLFKGDYFNLIKNQGLDPSEAMEVIRRSGKYPDFEDFISKGLSKYTTFSGKESDIIENAFMQGVNEGIVYKRTDTPVDNWRSKENLSYNNRKNLQDDAQQFQKEMSTPREILDKEGNSTGHYYDPKIGMIVDKEGAVVGDQSGDISKIGTGNRSTSTQSKEEKKAENLRKVNSVQGLKDLGYTPVFVAAKLAGSWRTGVEGEDAQGIWGDYTRSNLVSDAGVSFLGGWGHQGTLQYKPRDKNATMSVVSDFTKLPEEVKKPIELQAQLLGIDLDEDIQILRVQARDSRKDDYDYIIFRNNANL